MFLCSCHLSNHSVKLHWTHLYLQKKLKPREVKGLSQGYNEPKTKRTGSYDRKRVDLGVVGERMQDEYNQIQYMHM